LEALPRLRDDVGEVVTDLDGQWSMVNGQRSMDAVHLPV
jgi:hypothetical protein